MKLPARILDRINLNGPVPEHAPHLGPCRVWTGCLVGGYGQVTLEGRHHYVHRLTFKAAGRRTRKPQLDHLCRNRACCNPDHLEPVTGAENTRRGLAPVLARARHGAKTHCAQGHARIPENVRVDTRGNRVCLTCQREWSRASKARRKAA